MTEQPLSAVRSNRAVQYAGGIVLGLVVSSLHWLGILFGGMLVGLVAPTTGRGVLYGAGWGVLVWLVFAAWVGQSGVLPSPGAADLWVLSFGAAVVLGGIGGSARELRPLLQRLIRG